MADSKNVREELADLTEAVRELRDREVADTLRELRAEVEKLRAERAGHHCHGCSCTHIHWNTYPAPGCAPYYLPQVWYGTVTSGTTTVSYGDSVTATNGNVSAGGYNPTTTTLSLSN
jgi:hypothetical protein